MYFSLKLYENAFWARVQTKFSEFDTNKAQINNKPRKNTEI